MGSRVTSFDVAARAGVSRSAVSLVLNGRADGVISAENQAAVRRAAKDLGYRPNSVARSLRNATTHTIGVVTDSISSGSFGGPMIAGATAVAARSGYLLLTVDSHDDPDLEREAVATLRARQCDALLFAAGSLRRWRPADGFHEETALLLDAVDATGHVPGVIADERAGGRRATDAALAAGHRHLAYLTGTPDVMASDLRIEGHRAALAGSGASSRLVETGWSIDAGITAAGALLDQTDPPTAILCANDRVAAGVHLAAARRGLRIPEDLSVVGFDDDPNIAPQLDLTTVCLPHRAMGERAAELLLAALQGAPLPASDVLVDTPVVARRSVAAPRR